MHKFEKRDTALAFANQKFEDFYTNTTVRLLPLEESDRERFIIENQRAFNYGAMEEFGLRDDHFEEEEQIIARETIEQSIDSGEAYCIVADGKKLEVQWSKQMVIGVSWSFCLYHQRFIARASAMQRGVKSKNFIQKCESGKP